MDSGSRGLRGISPRLTTNSPEPWRFDGTIFVRHPQKNIFSVELSWMDDPKSHFSGIKVLEDCMRRFFCEKINQTFTRKKLKKSQDSIMEIILKRKVNITVLFCCWVTLCCNFFALYLVIHTHAHTGCRDTATVEPGHMLCAPLCHSASLPVPQDFNGLKPFGMQIRNLNLAVSKSSRPTLLAHVGTRKGKKTWLGSWRPFEPTPRA